MNNPLPSDLAATVQNALAEDIGSGDVSAQLISNSCHAQAQVISRESAVLCGCAWFDEVFRQLAAQVHIDWQAQDGDNISAKQVICSLSGPAAALLTGERTALNFLQLLSATATQTHRYVQAVAGTGVKILDTRKTLPGLRRAQKYAVCCGGGVNHRLGLYDAFLIKENHILAAGSITQAVAAARQQATDLIIEVEIETLAQIEEALASGVKQLLLDNFALPQLREAVALVQGRAQLEVSGGITVETLRAVAETGIDFISVGALTKDVKAIDFSMRILEICSLSE